MTAFIIAWFIWAYIALMIILFLGWIAFIARLKVFGAPWPPKRWHLYALAGAIIHLVVVVKFNPWDYW